MHFTKPSWVMHRDSSKSDQNAKRLSIFSVHVHPDGSRIATGGLDAKIRIWSTKPILNPFSEQSGRPPKSLCTLTMHTGPVLVVRWAHSGRWLASGSDDEIVMIWDLDPNARGKVWGSDEVNVEGWKPLKRLPGHESDVTDIGWSPEDRYLASVGLDSKVIIWCGYTLERLTKLDQHQGFVKGVCWDPVGEFLATQSDDRSVKIWRTSDWGLEAEVTKPFEDSPGSTFFRRLSWSPDGAHITASNATNNKGFVFIAAVITRNSWTSDISLVGHENTVEVAAYNPHIFLRNPSAPALTSNICSVVALGADDRSVSVWQTKSARPLIVAKEVFERQIMDLSWSWDGLTLYAASSDGTIAVFSFELDEMEGIAPHSVQEQYLQKFGFTPPPLPEGYSHFDKSRTSEQHRPKPAPSSTADFDVNGSGGRGGERVNVLIAKRNNKKRAQLTNGTGTSVSAPPASKRAQLMHVDDVPMASSMHAPPSTGASVSFPSPFEQAFEVPATETTWGKNEVAMDLDVPIDAIDAKGKRKASNVIDLTEDSRPATKARTLGGDKQRDTVPVKEIFGGGAAIGAWNNMGANKLILHVPPLLTSLTAEIEGSDDVFEGRNPEDGGLAEVFFASGKHTQWLDYLPSPVTALKATPHFCAAAMQDGSVNVYSHTGRKIMATLTLGSTCSFMEVNNQALLAITATGQLYCWNVKDKACYFPSTSIAPVFSSPNYSITSVAVRSNGSPIVTCSNGVVYSYDPSLQTFVKITERWWAEGSDAWQGRQRVNVQNTNRGVMSCVESSIGGTPPNETIGEKQQKPAWWDTALTLGHLETRLHATRLLDSPQEFKQAMLMYARKIGDEGFRGKAEELIKELFGPIYCRPGREENWSPTVIGLSKRDLLKDVLMVFARGKNLTKLAMDWLDILKKAASEE